MAVSPFSRMHIAGSDCPLAVLGGAATRFGVEAVEQVPQVCVVGHSARARHMCGGLVALVDDGHHRLRADDADGACGDRAHHGVEEAADHHHNGSGDEFAVVVTHQARELELEAPAVSVRRANLREVNQRRAPRRARSHDIVEGLPINAKNPEVGGLGEPHEGELRSCRDLRFRRSGLPMERRHNGSIARA